MCLPGGQGRVRESPGKVRMGDGLRVRDGEGSL